MEFSVFMVSEVGMVISIFLSLRQFRSFSKVIVANFKTINNTFHVLTHLISPSKISTIGLILQERKLKHVEVGGIS